MTSRKVTVQLKFVMLDIHRFVHIDETASIQQCLDALEQLDPALMNLLQKKHLVFDVHQRRLDLQSSLSEFGQDTCIVLLVL